MVPSAIDTCSISKARPGLGHEALGQTASAAAGSSITQDRMNVADGRAGANVCILWVRGICGAPDLPLFRLVW